MLIRNYDRMIKDDERKNATLKRRKSGENPEKLAFLRGANQDLLGRVRAPELVAVRVAPRWRIGVAGRRNRLREPSGSAGKLIHEQCIDGTFSPNNRGDRYSRPNVGSGECGEAPWAPAICHAAGGLPFSSLNCNICRINDL
jgi:hypothetical protein